MSSSSSAPPAKRPKLPVDLKTAGCTKNALARILSSLHANGMLKESFAEGSHRGIRKRIQKSVEEAGKHMTPYGLLIKKMTIDAPGCKELEYVCPFALLSFLADVCPSFFSMFTEAAKNTAKFKWVLYCDEICPGNPLRPTKSRTTQCVYWTFTNLPAHVLVQSGLWFVFGTVRTTVVEHIPGAISGFIRKVMRIFCAEHGHSLHRGVVLKHQNQSLLVTAEFAGFIADEKALKEIYCFKGASGSKPCPSCANVVRFLDSHARDGSSLVTLACADFDLLQPHTDTSIWRMFDRLRALEAANQKTELKQMEQIFGLNLCEDSLLADAYLRTVVKPSVHVLRDWMHTLVSKGVAGTEMAFLIAKLVEWGINHDQISNYASQFHLPKGRGKVDPAWFAAGRVGFDHLRTFASEQLNMMPILLAFLEDVVQPIGVLQDHIRCFTQLNLIVCILKEGPSGAMSQIELLRSTIVAHNTLSAALYEHGEKVKFHQLMHLPGDMQNAGALLSCFPTERKHRQVKGIALSVFRNFEHTVLNDLLNQVLDGFCDESQYKQTALHDPLHVQTSMGEVCRSTAARTPSGEVHCGDLVWLQNGRVGRVVAFWGPVDDDQDWVAQMEMLASQGDYWIDTAATVWVESSEILTPVVWAVRRPNVYRVCKPLGAVLRS